jgi:hypothetical protein
MSSCEDWTRSSPMMWAGGSTRVGPCGRRIMGYCAEVYRDYQTPATEGDAATYVAITTSANDDGSVRFWREQRTAR